MSVDRQLADYIARGRRTPFVWGGADCCFWLADWILERRGVDPGARFRGTYATREAAEDLQREHGGLEGLLATLAAEARLREVRSARAGDVGLLSAPTPNGILPIGGIFDGRWWHARSLRAIVSAPATPSIVWRV